MFKILRLDNQTFGQECLYFVDCSGMYSTCSPYVLQIILSKSLYQQTLLTVGLLFHLVMEIDTLCGNKCKACVGHSAVVEDTFRLLLQQCE